MKVLLTWLREFAPIEGDPAEIGDSMSALGMAVESMEVIDDLDGIVVAKVMNTRAHPEADRIHLVDVDAGTGEPIQVCCGAFNMVEGDLVPLATVGSTMPDGMEIAKRQMRGQDSNGMLCSAAELGFGTDHAGILILPADLDIGASVVGALGLRGEVLYDLEINPNRPDAMSIAGVARDLAAHQGVEFTMPVWTVEESAREVVGDVASVVIHDPTLCGRFVARVLRNVSVGESPPWMQLRLAMCGMRPINSVVDVSNYVMLELGTPNHTYDLGKVPAGHLGVRRARDGETIVTLDDVERTLTSSDGVIVDEGDIAIGIAGVMGGASTEIGEDTTSVLVELAWWWPRRIAESSTRLGLRSEASTRFERGTDWALNPNAVNRFCSLLADQGATVAKGQIDVTGDLPVRPVVSLRTARVNHLLGTDLTSGRIAELLTPIGFEVEPDVGGVTQTKVPSFRPDTETETDIIEEVARHHGYESIEKTVPRSPVAGHLTDYQLDRRALRNVLAGAGFNEVIPSPFLAEDALRRTGLDDSAPVTLVNPLTADESVMRPSLLPGVLGSISYNASHRNLGVRLFEIGHVFATPRDGELLPDETEWVGIAIAGESAGAAKTAWDLVATSLDVRGVKIVNTDDIAGMHPTRAAQLIVEDSAIGHIGEVDPGVLDAWGISERVAWVEVQLDAMLALPHGTRPYAEVSTQPSSDVDLAFVVADEVQASAIESTLRTAGGSEVASIALFDVFRSGQLDADTRSLAFALRLQADDHTLTEDEIAEIRRRCIDAVEHTHAATLRS